MSDKPHTLTLDFPEMNPAERIQELVLYIADRSQGDNTFGRTKLAKILYFADFASYRKYKQPITGSAYVRWQYGPVPEHFLDILDEMESSRQIVTIEADYFEHEQKRVTPIRKADVSMFSGRDIQIIEDVIRRFWNRSAKEISEESHGIAWKSTAPDQKIPYEYSQIDDSPLTQAELDHAMQLAKAYGVE